MNTVRAARRWIYVRRRYSDVDRRVLFAVALVCVAVFAACFALGRITRPAGPRELGTPGVQLGSTNAAAPVSLLPAPPVELEQVVRASVQASPVRPPAPVATVAVSRPASITAPPRSTPTTAPQGAAPTAEPAPRATSAPSTTPRGGGATGHTPPKSSPGTSFDTSG